MSASKLISNWTFNKRKLPEPFQDYSDSPRVTNLASKYCSQLKKQCTLHASMLRAVLAFMDIEAPLNGTEPEGAIGSQSNNYTVAEYPSRMGELHAVVYNRLTGKFIAGRYDKPVDQSNSPNKYILKEDGNSGAALFFALLPTALEDEECNEYYQKLKVHRLNGYVDLRAAAEVAAIFCDNLYRRLRYGDSLTSGIALRAEISGSGAISPLKTMNVENGTYAPTNVISGRFQVFTPKTHIKPQYIIKPEDFIAKYPLTETRILSPSEESMVPSIADWYIIPEEIKLICEHAKATTLSQQPMRNFLLRGPSGTGKTEGAKAIAAGLHLPYCCFTCSANTEILDLLGQILPDLGDENCSKVDFRYHPTVQELLLDPVTVYERLTGVYDETATEDKILQMLWEIYMNHIGDPVAALSYSPSFRYVDTPLVEAIRNGWVVEVQEPTVIANPGVLVGLNSLLDRCNCVTLPNGEIITRHPDTIIVVTTNIEYAGCKGINQSVISRMNLIMDIDEPDEDTLVARVLGITGCTDKSAVVTMARIVKSISEYCRQNLITDGCCGVRELISWVQSYMICKDIEAAANITVLSSVSADVDSREEIRQNCIDTFLAA